MATPGSPSSSNNNYTYYKSCGNATSCGFFETSSGFFQTLPQNLSLFQKPFLQSVCLEIQVHVCVCIDVHMSVHLNLCCQNIYTHKPIHVRCAKCLLLLYHHLNKSDALGTISAQLYKMYLWCLFLFAYFSVPLYFLSVFAFQLK